jgi:hypothetical protein
MILICLVVLSLSLNLYVTSLNVLIEKRNQFNVKAFESALKKSKFLNEVYFQVDIKDKKINEIILKLIIKSRYYLK